MNLGIISSARGRPTARAHHEHGPLSCCERPRAPIPARAAPWLGCLLVTTLGAGCEPETDLARSCNGEPVGLCGPSEHAEVEEASLEPAELPIGDFSVDATIHVALDRCPDAPAPHEVDLWAFVPDTDPPDGEAGGRVITLLTLADGEDGDPTAGDGVIDVTVTNPFISTVPAETDLFLRFIARSTTPGGCTSGVLEIPYRTGPAG